MSKSRRNTNRRTMPQAKDGKIHIVNLESYSRPDIKEYSNQDWISYGDDNNYFEYLIDRYNGSPTNNAAINGIAEMIYGKGLDATDGDKNQSQYDEMKELFTKDCMKKICYDYKMMGQAALQIIYTKDRKKIAQVEHMPVETLRAEKCNSKGEIEAYFYHSNWDEYKQSDKLKRIPAFGKSKSPLEILYIKPYRAGYKYYSPVDYQGGLQYAELEEEVANYHINNIQNGLAPSMLINFNNGVPPDEQREMIERSIVEKFSGSSNAGRFILAFNDSKELAATIEPVQLSDAHQQYQFLSDESMRKVMVSHRIVSPMLVGIKDSTGLGNNAEELQTASVLMDNTVIRPMQVTILDELEKVLMYNGIELDIYFKTLQPLEFTDLTNAISESEIEKETGVKKDQVDEEPQIEEEE
ncbi:phage portal protein [Candidatus Pelagibacter sp.]|nr:phage portal protein [Candidatus Pelagibacter sp.]